MTDTDYKAVEHDYFSKMKLEKNQPSYLLLIEIIGKSIMTHTLNFLLILLLSLLFAVIDDFIEQTTDVALDGADHQ